MYSDGRSLDEPCDDWRDLDLCFRGGLGWRVSCGNSECLLNWCNIHCEMNESSVSVRDGKWVVDLIWPLSLCVLSSDCFDWVDVTLWKVNLVDLWDGREFGLCLWCDWMTHSYWVEKLLNVCRVDVSLWKVSEWTFEMDENSFSIRGVNELKNSYDSCNWFRVLIVWWMFFLFSKNY